MTIYDVFNGDADGICALVQLRQNTPCQSQLITGIKRDIQLLAKVHASAGDQITVLDISLDKNRSDLSRNLTAGAQIFYVDHHFCGDIPDNDQLHTLIDTQANTCTSLLMNQHLQNKYPLWAITGAFGDNLNASAQALAKAHALDANSIEQLQSLGIYLNYNGYGASCDDLHFAPDALFKALYHYQNPLEVVADKDSIYPTLQAGYNEDNTLVAKIQAEHQTEAIAVFILPNQAWARRISGVFSNRLANQFPQRAHAVLTQNNDRGFLVSVRAPLNNKTGADELCRQFTSGGGRKAAAGINHLAEHELSVFIKKFSQQFA